MRRVGFCSQTKPPIISSRLKTLPLPVSRSHNFFPHFRVAVQTQRSTQFRTELRCRGRRNNGEAFLAAVWFSTYITSQGPSLAAIIVDLSEDLRDREDLSLDHLLKNTKILMGAVAHEIRNLCGAILAVYKNLSRLPDLQNNEDFRALGSLIAGFEKLSDMELLPPWIQPCRQLTSVVCLMNSAFSSNRSIRRRGQDYLALARSSSFGDWRSLRIAAGFPQSCSQ